jgi:hypothetical protein
MSVQEQLSRAGLGNYYNPNDPLMQTYEQIALTYKSNKTPVGFHDLAVASMMVRATFYWKNSPGDCAYSTPVGQTGTQELETVGSAAATNFGVPVVANILDLFNRHHTQAVITEQTTTCDVSGKVNAAWASLDAGIAAGQYQINEALSYLQRIQSVAIAELNTFKKDCNTACVYIRVISCITDLRSLLYKSAYQSGGAPALMATAGLLSQSSINQPVAGVGGPQAYGAIAPGIVPSFGFSISSLLPILIIGALVLFVLLARPHAGGGE